MQTTHAKNGRALVATVVAALAAAVAVVMSCTSTPAPVGLAQGCSINSDCQGSLVCAFGRCHVACVTSKDCSGGGTCVLPGVCQLPSETKCTETLPCVSGLTCVDDKCLASCGTDGGGSTAGLCVADQVCTTEHGQQVCVTIDAGAPDSGHDAGHTADAHVDGGAGDATLHDGAAPREAAVDSGTDSPVSNDSGSHDAGHDASQPEDAGCVLLEAGSGPLGYTPSNFDPLQLVGLDGGSIPLDAASDGSIDWTASSHVNVVVNASCNANQTNLAACIGVPPVTITLSGMNTGAACYPNCVADLYVMNSLKIETGVSLSAWEANGRATNPIILAVRTVVQIDGTLSVASMNGGPGPGGFPWSGNSTNLTGPGGGGSGNYLGTFPFSSPSGGGFCGRGGEGAIFADGGSFTPEGPAYGSPTIQPLQAGSAGGYLTSGLTPGGSGGGLQISAGQSITVGAQGIVNASGSGQCGGGGSGGALLLEAPTILVEGVLAANGGSGGGAIPSATCSLGASGTPNATPAPGAQKGGAFGGVGSAGAMINGGAGKLADAGTMYYAAGGGGAGWIRINTARPCSFASTLDSGTTFISPPLNSGCASLGTINQ
jgi:hypothetical protein